MDDGRYQSDSAEDILEALMADAKEYWGEDLNDTSWNIIETFYRPIAVLLAETQQDIGLVLDSAQIEHAEGQALSLLTALIGIKRDPANRATGTVKFSRDSPASTSYTIPGGTRVQTDSNDPVVFETNDSEQILGPTTSSDSTTYSTTNGSYVTKASFTVDVTYRDSIDVQSDIRTTDGTVAAELEIADATNTTQLHTGSTTNTSFTTSGPATYDVSGLTGDITIEYRLRSGDGATSVEMTDATVEKGGETATKAAVEAIEGGVDGNVGANTLVVMPDPPSGVESATNPASTSGGTDREEDDELRQRAQEELAQGSRASAPALVNSVQGLDGVTSVSIFVNDTNTDNTGSGGLPEHSFEIVAAGGNTNEIGGAILETKAAGDTSYGGANGTKTTASDVELPNGQTLDVDFSRPSEVQIYVDVTVDKTDEYAGDDELKDAIVEYIGGIRTSGTDVDGLDVGENVIYTELMAQIQMVEGVYDVPTLEVGTSADPTGTSNITIADSEIATSDGTDSSLTVTTNSV